MNITQKQLDQIEWALRIADFWLDSQQPSDQVALDAQDVRAAYNVIDCVKRGNVTTKLAYHAKADAHGWKHIVTTRIDAPEWSDWDRQAYRHMVEQGTSSLVMGWNMWELIQEQAQ